MQILPDSFQTLWLQRKWTGTLVCLAPLILLKTSLKSLKCENNIRREEKGGDMLAIQNFSPASLWKGYLFLCFMVISVSNLRSTKVLRINKKVAIKLLCTSSYQKVLKTIKFATTKKSNFAERLEKSWV